MSDFYIARQPIYNRTQHVHGYELLYRTGDVQHANVADADAATSETMLNAFTDIGLENLVGGRVAFVNLSRGFLVGAYPLPLPGNRVAIEVPHTELIDKELTQGVARLSRQGYTVVLDDFVYSEEAEPLLKVASIVKLDVQALNEESVRQHVGLLKNYDKLKLLASKVEVLEEYEVCRELGFHFFQGFFFSRPRIIRRKRIPNNQMVLMQLLAELQRPDVSVPKLEALISRDVGLSYKLLRYINSAFFGLSKPIESIQRAIVLLGIKIIQHWSTLLVLARVDDKPNELMITSVVRAKMCSLLAAALGREEVDAYFTIGLLSVLDALLDMDMEKVLDMLTMSGEINGALLDREGEGGAILDLVLRYEQGEWESLHHDKLDKETIKEAYLQAVSWATEACRILLGEA